MVLWHKLASNIGASRAHRLLLLSKNRSQATDLGAKRSADMLRSVRDKVLDTTHDVVEENVTVDKSAEAGNLASNSGSHLSLIVLEKLYKCGNKIPGDNLLIYCLGNLQDISMP